MLTRTAADQWESLIGLNRQARTTSGHLIRARDLVKEIGLSRTTIWREVRDGRLAQPVALSRRCVGWRSEDIDAWKASRKPVER